MLRVAPGQVSRYALVDIETNVILDYFDVSTDVHPRPALAAKAHWAAELEQNPNLRLCVFVGKFEGEK